MLAATASLEAARLIISSTEQACFLLKFIGYVCYTSLYMKLMYMHEFLHGYCLVFTNAGDVESSPYAQVRPAASAYMFIYVFVLGC